MSSQVQISLILGGVSSGKSSFAEGLVLNASGTPIYIATAEAHDAEMAAKIAAHRAERADQGWITLEEPLDLAGALNAAPAGPVLVDCLTMWLSNLMHQDQEPDCAAVIAAAKARGAPVVFVSNEVGLGGVAANSLARRFARAQGGVNAAFGAAAGRVVLVAAAIPLALKGELP